MSTPFFKTFFGWNYSVDELVTKRESIPVCTSLVAALGSTVQLYTQVSACVAWGIVPGGVGWGGLGGGYHCSKNVV